MASGWPVKASRSNPSTRPKRGDLAGEAASQSQVDAAVKAARTAFYHWSDLALEERLAIVRRYADLLGEHKEALALTIARETGKPLWETRTEVAAMQGKIAISIRAHDERTGTVENPHAGRQGVRAPQAPWRRGRVRPLQLPGPPAQRPHCAGAHRRQCGRVQAFRADPMVAEAMVKVWQEAGCPRGAQPGAGEVDTGKALAGNRTSTASSSPVPPVPATSCISSLPASRARSWHWRWVATTR